MLSLKIKQLTKAKQLKAPTYIGNFLFLIQSDKNPKNGDPINIPKKSIDTTEDASM